MRKHRVLRDWVYIAMAIGVFVAAIVAAGLLEVWIP